MIERLRLFQSGLRVIVACAMLVINGCCDPDYTAIDWVNTALRRYPLTTFVDSSGEYLQIIVIDSSFDRISIYDERGRDCYAYFPRTHGMFYPEGNGPYMRYTQNSGYKTFRILDINFGLPPSNLFQTDSTLIIQGFAYQNCMYLHKSDSLGNLKELALHAQYGLVLFSSTGHYRWERVLDP